jgi:hypothetical protein
MTNGVRFVGLAVVAGIVLGAPVAGVAQEIAAAYGTRLPPLPPGEGGDVLVTAPGELCADDSHELQIRRYVTDKFGSGILYVLREPTGPSPCRWDIRGLRAANYDAVIRRRRDDQIVAVAPNVDVEVGRLSELRVDFAQVEVVGKITTNGQPAANFQLFIQGEPLTDWQVPIHEDGSYSATLTSSSSSSFCLWLKSAKPQSIGMFDLGCRIFAPGMNHFDGDVQVPSGVIHVEVTPFGKPVTNDWTAPIVVIKSAHSEESSASFKASAGFNGEYLGAKFGEYDVSVQTLPAHRILSRATVSLSRDHPVGRVTLTIPPGALGCDDGWWSACANPEGSGLR